MLRNAGHDVLVYWGGDRADVSLMPVEEQEQFFGKWNPASLPVIDWKPQNPYWKVFHQRAISEITERVGPTDIIGFIGGCVAQEVIDVFKQTHTVIEPGVGYEGISPDTFACFETYAWMHNRYGACGIGNGRAFDTVIPNAVFPDEWYTSESRGYALFVGRLIQRKGPHVAAEIANAAGLKLLMAGGGVAHKEPGRIIATDGTVIKGDVEHVGPVVGEDRKRLFAEAEVLICPTLYIGPWEGVHAEAMMSGVPVVAPDYGAFTETLPVEYRYRNMSQAVKAVKRGQMTRGSEWRRHAINLCGVDRCERMYDDWIDRLMSLRDGRKGWYS